MKVTETALPGVLLVEPKVFGDARGFFLETFHLERYREAGITLPFVQDNLSRSSRGILRGLHLQQPHAQGKLVWVPDGVVFDVAVDVRVGSPTFGRWVGFELSGENHRQLWIPPGFAHGFVVVSERCLFAYKCTDLYHPESELGVAWDDPDLGIEWPLRDVTLSSKDAKSPRLRDIDAARLPRFEGRP
ncbi:MAG: dTDP-4-dehydrorhamnose 3,5-epimerase [Sandaracinaceae bacterium]